MTGEFENKVRSRVLQLGVDIDGAGLGQLARYCDMMIEKNKVMNLTAITDEDEVISKHIIDSLSIVSCFDLFSVGKGQLRMIDIGTGAGIPGMILKIVFPALEVTLFDSLKKRLVFLDEVIEDLKLEGVRTVHGRAEDFGRDRKFREQFDIAVSRAVANMSALSEYCLPFVRKNGVFAAYKSAESHDEIEAALGAIGKLGGELEKEAIFTLPDSEIERRIALIRKVRNTPAAYPRKAGTPSKDPLK